MGFFKNGVAMGVITFLVIIILVASKTVKSLYRIEKLFCYYNLLVNHIIIISDTSDNVNTGLKI